MKLSWSFILSSLYCSASSAKVGHVYLHDPSPKSFAQAPEAVNPETARLILAQRLGLSRFHSIKHPSDEIIQQINVYGGIRPKLFGEEDPDRTKAHLLIWLEDVEDAGVIIQDPAPWTSSFSISNPPPASDNDRLIEDIILQAESLVTPADPKQRTYSDTVEVETWLSKFGKVNTYNDYLSIFRADKSDKLSLHEVSNHIGLLLQKASSSGEDGFSMTVVLMPPSSAHTKRSAQPYGTYDLPSTIEARRENPEAPLSPSSSKPSTSPKPKVPDLEDFPVIAQANDSSPVLGILKSCYSTLSACQKQTNNCSSHGECKLLRKGQKGSDSQLQDCYGCACSPTVKHVGEDKGMETKKKTTYWGGPACQKKDVSVPFWLFVGAGVFLAFLISTGIGMLYSIGNEELPSVIGAGVSGPTRK